MVRGDLLLNTWWTVVLVALVPGILVASDYSLWLLPLIGIPLVAIQLGSRQAVINEHEARHDRVTGLSNREDVARVLEHALHRAGRQGAQVGVLMVGLSRFKEINETLGHRRGDLVLIEVARRLAGIARPQRRRGAARRRRVRRRSSRRSTASTAACAAAERALAALRAPVVIRGVELDLGAHAGVACHPEHGTSLRRAAAPRRRRARAGEGVAPRGWSSTPSDFDEHGVERLTLVSELSRAIAAGELELVFQPQVELATGRLRAVEALVRWPHPERGPLSPEEFIEPAEQTGVIRALTLWVVRAALDQAERWHAAGLDLRVAVNLSVRSITPELPRDLALILDGAHAARWSSRSPRPSAWWTPSGALAVLEELTALGIRLSVDDFGTGLLVAGLPQAAAGQRDQDRPLVRDGDGPRGQRPRDRALDRRPRPPPRDGGRRRGRREQESLRRAARARLPPGPGLRDQPAARRGGARRMGAARATEPRRSRA